jgi:hypothetical protein
MSKRPTVCCVRVSPRLSACGRDLPPFEWAFTSWRHAHANERQGGRLTTCPDCTKAEQQLTLKGIR